MGKWGWRRLTQLGTVQLSHVRNSAYATQQLDTVEPCPVISSMLPWIHRYATLCNALFSMMWRIPQKCKQNFGGDLSTIATLMFAVLHVLLNSSSREYTEHPWKVYASILGVSYPPLLGWCSSATVISPTRMSIHNIHHFAIHRFQGCRTHLYEVYDTFNTAWHCLVKSC